VVLKNFWIEKIPGFFLKVGFNKEWLVMSELVNVVWAKMKGYPWWPGIVRNT
jgi:hypothetical protein